MTGSTFVPEIITFLYKHFQPGERKKNSECLTINNVLEPGKLGFFKFCIKLENLETQGDRKQAVACVSRARLSLEYF